jgi:hypothetical protein
VAPIKALFVPVAWRRPLLRQVVYEMCHEMQFTLSPQALHAWKVGCSVLPAGA